MGVQARIVTCTVFSASLLLCMEKRLPCTATPVNKCCSGHCNVWHDMTQVSVLQCSVRLETLPVPAAAHSCSRSCSTVVWQWCRSVFVACCLQLQICCCSRKRNCASHAVAATSLLNGLYDQLWQVARMQLYASLPYSKQCHGCHWSCRYQCDFFSDCRQSQSVLPD